MIKSVFIFILATNFLFANNGIGQSHKPPGGIEHIIVIGIDGLSPDGVLHAKDPVMKRMISNGAVKRKVRTVLPSDSSPNWASMISGAGPEQHGVRDNDWERDKHSLPPVVSGQEGIFPTIFGVIHSARPGAEIGAVYNWSGFGRLFEKNAVNYDTTFSSADATVACFVRYLSEKKPVFSFVHMDHVDHAGHEFGHGSDAYYQAVSNADSLIGKILNTVEKSGMAGNTLIIVTADHGGKGRGHGGATPQEAEITTIYYGKGVKKGYEIRQPVYTYDLAATIAFCFGITPPYAWIGRPTKSAFEGFAEPAN
jgi:predicted AlkP superfamily pyrophosphatase or phosphodiesterase